MQPKTQGWTSCPNPTLWLMAAAHQPSTNRLVHQPQPHHATQHCRQGTRMQQGAARVGAALAQPHRS
jgi:hypothetical protein